MGYTIELWGHDDLSAIPRDGTYLEWVQETGHFLGAMHWSSGASTAFRDWLSRHGDTVGLDLVEVLFADPAEGELPVLDQAACARLVSDATDYEDEDEDVWVSELRRSASIAVRRETAMVGAYT